MKSQPPRGPLPQGVPTPTQVVPHPIEEELTANEAVHVSSLQGDPNDFVAVRLPVGGMNLGLLPDGSLMFQIQVFVPAPAMEDPVSTLLQGVDSTAVVNQILKQNFPMVTGSMEVRVVVPRGTLKPVPLPEEPDEESRIAGFLDACANSKPDVD